MPFSDHLIGNIVGAGANFSCPPNHGFVTKIAENEEMNQPMKLMLYPDGLLGAFRKQVRTNNWFSVMGSSLVSKGKGAKHVGGPCPFETLFSSERLSVFFFFFFKDWLLLAFKEATGKIRLLKPQGVSMIAITLKNLKQDSAWAASRAFPRMR